MKPVSAKPSACHVYVCSTIGIDYITTHPKLARNERKNAKPTHNTQSPMSNFSFRREATVQLIRDAHYSAF